jgi:hypothetical protein
LLFLCIFTAIFVTQNKKKKNVGLGAAEAASKYLPGAEFAKK